MSNLLIGLVGALMATNQPTAISNLVVQTTGVSVRVPDNPAEVELDRLMADDDAALAEIDGWIQENQAFKQKGAGIPDKELNQRINKRLDQVRRAYDGYLKRYTNSASGRIAYASFLDHVGEEE